MIRKEAGGEKMKKNKPVGTDDEDEYISIEEEEEL